ncbi:MAG: gliding motility-associated C-terminal domain-containing protein [Vicingus serpentipes]|nr:gliding motility-associated C-terminal domain-containing protein [Vicingus serpentipes]
MNNNHQSSNTKIKHFVKLFIIMLFFVEIQSNYAQTVNISNTTLNSCNATIYDDGGPSGNYSTAIDYTMTICATSGSQLYILVEELMLGAAFNGDVDILKIYAGTGTGGTVLFDSDIDSPSKTNIITANNGCITIEHLTDPHFFATDPGPGFKIVISCALPETCGDGILNNGEIMIDCGGPNCNPCYTSTVCFPNVITNGDFETPDPTVCGAVAGGPFGTANQIPRPWLDQTPVANWLGTAIRIDNNISYPTADYRNSSCTNSGTNPLMNGSGSMGYHAYFVGSQSSEYIQQQLAAPLVAGEEYCVSVLAASDPSDGPNDGFGLWFHNRTFASGNGFVDYVADNASTPFLGVGTTVNAIQTVGQAPGEFIPTTPTTLKYSFCAVGGEEYVVIGNFNPGTSSVDYIFFDDVSVVPSCPITFDCNIIESGVPDCAGSCVDLTANPTNQAGGCELTNDFTYLWSTGDTSATINVCPTVGTTYYVDVTYTAGCKSATQRCQVNYCGVTIGVTLVGDTVCAGETGTLTPNATGGDGNYTYSWTGGGITGNNGNPETDNPNTTTTYIVLVTDGNGDTASATADIVIKPVATGSQTLSECDGFSTTVNGNTYTTTGIYTDTITGGGANGCDSIVTTDLTIIPTTSSSQTLVECTGFSITINGNTYTTTGIYTDTITGGNANGCDSIVTTDLTISSFVFGAQTLTECDGFSTTVNGNTYTTTGIYTDTLVGASVGGCDSIVTTDLTIVFPPNAGTSSLVMICSDDLPFNLFDSLGGTPDGGGVWSPTLNSGTGVYAPNVDPTGIYTYTVTNSPCPSAFSTVTVSMMSGPTIGITTTDDDCGNGQGSISLSPLTGTPPYTYSWNSGSTDSTLIHLIMGTYTVTVSDMSPCPSIYTITINDPKIDCDSIFIPNVFTPNNDGSNDVFTIEVMGIKELSATIYNRWGQVVANEFKTKGILENIVSKLEVWNGRTSSGAEVPAGTYYFIVEYTTSSGDIKKNSGFLTLLK